MATTWDSAKKDSLISLSGGDLVASLSSGADDKSVLAVHGVSSGKYYWEIEATNVTPTIYGSAFGVGIALSSSLRDYYIGWSNDSIAYFSTQSGVLWNGDTLGITGAAEVFGEGDIVCVAFDADNLVFYVRKNNGPWCGATLTANPVAGTGGYVMSSPAASGPWYPAVGLANGDIATGRFSASSWSYSPPSGFSELGPVGDLPFQPVGNQPPGGVRGATVAHAEAAPVLDATSATVGAIYVATTGNDTTGTGTLANPYATVGKASTVVAAGQHILMRGGTYSGAQVQFSGPGTPSQPIVLQPYNNETVIIDGTGTPAATDLLAVGGTYCIVRGLQVRNATQSGIALWQTVGCVVERCTIYNCQQSAIWIGTDTPGTSHHNTVRWNTAYNCGLVNASEALGGGGGWPSIIKFEISDNFECVYNTVYESWGEGIGADSCSTGGLIAYNTVRDCYSVLIYLDNTARTIVTGNVLSGINSAWYKLGAQTDSILVANESVSPVQIASDNLQVTGNFITGKHTAQWTGGGGTYQTLSNSALDPNFYLAALAESGSAADTQSQTLSGGGGATYNESTAETGSASDTPAATLVRVGAVAETGTAADTPAAALVAVGETAEAGSAADTPSAASVRAGAAAEAGSAVDTPATALVAVGAAAETGSAADTPAASTVRVGAVAETGSAADTSDFSVGGVSATAETLSAADTSSALIVGAGATAETGSASDTPAATAIRVGAAAETGAASDTPAAAAVRAGAVAETAAATDTPAASQVAAGSVAESLAALDTSDGAGGAVLSVAESGSASDTTSATLVRATTVAETGSAADTPAVTAVRAGAVTETGAATDTAAATAAMGGAVAETMSGFDTLLAILASANAVAESGSASDTVEALAAFIPVSTIVYLLGVIEELAELRGFIDRTAELRGNLDPDVELIGTSFNP